LRIDAKDSDITWIQKLDGDQDANYDKLRLMVTQKKKEGVENNVISEDFDIESQIKGIKELSIGREIPIKIHLPTGRYQRKIGKYNDEVASMSTGSQIAGGGTHKLVYIGTFGGTLEVLLVKDGYWETFTLMQRYNFPNQAIKYIFYFDKKVLLSAGGEVVVLKQDFSEILGSGGKRDYEIEKVEEEDEIFRWPMFGKYDMYNRQICVSEDIKYFYFDLDGQQ
jgi:hypothetical protein